jgi:uncharacterized protein YndB with AHSA1/START domain
LKWVLFLAPFAVGLVAAIGFVVIVGACISRTHSATRSVRLAAAPEAVWAVITDFPNHPSWRPGLKSVEPLPPRNGHPVWNERSAGMGGDELPIEIEVFEPPRRMVGRIVDDGLPFGGTWTYEVSPEVAGCRVRITEDGFIKPAVFRYVARTLGYTATMEKYLRALAKKFGAEGLVEP